MTAKQPSSGSEDEASQQDSATPGATDAEQPAGSRNSAESSQTDVEVEKEIDRIARYLKGPTAFSA